MNMPSFLSPLVMANRLATVFAVFTTVVTACFSAVICYWLLIDVKPPLTSASVEILDIYGKPTIYFKPGDVMMLKRNACVSDSGPALFTRIIRGPYPTNTIFFAPSGYANFGADDACRTLFNEVPLPHHLPPGKYEYIAQLQFQNNPLKTTTQSLPTVWFYIYEDKK